MRHRHPSGLLVTALGLLLIVVASGAAAPVLGADCGGVMTCSCGDTVRASRTLVCGVDPVTTTPCPGNGLTVARTNPMVDPPVTLNLNFCTIRGDGGVVGIVIADSLVVVASGKITGFGQGVNTAPMFATTGSKLTGLQVFANGDGIDVEASQTEITKSVIRNNSGNCLRLRNSPAADDANTVSLNRCEDNGGSGLIIRGVGNTVARNVLLRNGGDGADIGGRDATVDRNQAKYSGARGFLIDGQDHVVTLNIAQSNDSDGFHVLAVDSSFERNVSSYNELFGIFDATIGGGTAMTANTYINNKCTGNGAGKSAPPGLC